MGLSSTLAWPGRRSLEMRTTGPHPPSHELLPEQVRRARKPEMVDYTQGGHGRPGQAPKPDMSRITGFVRHDLVKAQRMAAQQARQEQIRGRGMISLTTRSRVPGSMHERRCWPRPFPRPIPPGRG
jgi:hypothetical protein